MHIVAARLRVVCAPDCAASGFFQCLVGYGENEKLLVGLVESVISKAGMLVHGK